MLHKVVRGKSMIPQGVCQQLRRICPWDLFMDITKPHFTGKCNLVKGIVTSVGTEGILEMKTYPSPHPNRIITSIRWGIFF